MDQIEITFKMTDCINVNGERKRAMCAEASSEGQKIGSTFPFIGFVPFGGYNNNEQEWEYLTPFRLPERAQMLLVELAAALTP